MPTLEKVVPTAFKGYNTTLLQFFGMGPKFKIKCGKCELWFSERLQLIDEPPVICPYCKVINVLPLTLVSKRWDED